MNARTKFWLKVVLAVTFPAWILPAAILGAAAAIVCFIWDGCSSMVDDLTESRE